MQGGGGRFRNYKTGGRDARPRVRRDSRELRKPGKDVRKYPAAKKFRICCAIIARLRSVA